LLAAFLAAAASVAAFASAIAALIFASLALFSASLAASAAFFSAPFFWLSSSAPDPESGGLVEACFYGSNDGLYPLTTIKTSFY
jgi:hypothetical protein